MQVGVGKTGQQGPAAEIDLPWRFVFAAQRQLPTARILPFLTDDD